MGLAQTNPAGTIRTAMHAPSPTIPAAPPRPTTARAARRAWTDPHVRFWWATAAVLLVIGVYFVVTRYLDWRQSAQLVQSGQQVLATVVEADGIARKGNTSAADRPVRLQYEYNGKAYDVGAAYLEGRPSTEAIVVGSTVPIRIDPNQPDRWTPRTEPAPLAHELIGGIFALPIALLLLLISLWTRGRILRTWREAPAIEATVMSARHTALAPRAWSVQCSPADEADARLFTVFGPPDLDVTAGATVWLIVRPVGGRPLAAAWFN